jgi:hypothetical protein
VREAERCLPRTSRLRSCGSARVDPARPSRQPSLSGVATAMAALPPSAVGSEAGSRSLQRRLSAPLGRTGRPFGVTSVGVVYDDHHINLVLLF